MSFSAMDISTSALVATRARLDAISGNIANLSTIVNEQGQNIAKTALVYSSWDDVTVGAQLHRYCAGGLDAVEHVR